MIRGLDLYPVATKLIKELPRPVLLSGGLISTDGPDPRRPRI